MMKSPTELESFNLDHSKVRAPYIRVAGRYQGERGDRITKYDLRLVQPNEAEIPTAALHTIEHLIAGYLRDALEEKIIDASPMGCRTGFYLTVLGSPRDEDVRQALETALKSVSSHEGAIPGCSPLECGNYRDHSLPGAKAWAEQVLAHDIIVQETIPLER